MINLGRIVRNFFSVTVMRIFTSIISFVFFSLLARKWGAESLGEFSTIFSVFMFLWQLPLLGLHVIIARRVAASPETSGEQASNALILSLCVSVILMFLVGVFGYKVYAESMQTALWLVGFSSVFMAVTSVAEGVLIGQEKMNIIAWGNAGENIFRVIIGLILVLMGYGLTPVVAVFVFARVIAILIYMKYGGMWEMLDLKFVSKVKVLDYLKKSPTFFGILLLSVIVGRIDFIVLSLMVSMKDVGMYSPPFKIYEIGLMVPSMITVVIFPAFARCFESARDQFAKLYLDMFRFVFILGAPAVILLANASGFLIDLVFGSEYSDGSGVLQLLALTILIIALDQVMTTVTLAGHREDLEFKILVIACAVYLALLFLLVSLTGYIGAAIATMTASFIKLVVRYFWVKNKLELPDAVHLLYRPVIAILPLLLVLYFLKDSNVFLSSFLGLAVYVAMLFAVKGITINDITSFRSAITQN